MKTRLILVFAFVLFGAVSKASAQTFKLPSLGSLRLPTSIKHPDNTSSIKGKVTSTEAAGA
jgi:hypothetical protein